MPNKNVSLLIHKAHGINSIREDNFSNQLLVSEPSHVVGAPDLDLSGLTGSDYKI